MNISKKFFTSAILLLGIVTGILIGNAVVVQRIKNAVQEKSNLTMDTIKAALETENALQSEISLLKDKVLFKHQPSEIANRQNQFLNSLDKLAVFMPDDPEISLIRSRHISLTKIADQLVINEKNRMSIDEYQEYFLDINSYNKDINAMLKKVIERAYDKRLLMKTELDNIYQVQAIITIEIIGVILILFTVTFNFVWRPVIRSLKQLQMGTEEIAAGNLEYRLDIVTGDEVEKLAGAFNYMAMKLTEFRETLVKNNELTEINQRLELEIHERKQIEIALKNALEKLKNTQAQLIQTEKMSSLGQLVAGIAHEINNPVNFISGNIIHISEYAHELLNLISLYNEEFPNPSDKIQDKIEEIDLEFILEDLPKVINSMQIGSNRIREIVLSLRTFSRLDEADMKEVDIHEGINSTLLILQNRLKAKSEHPEIKVIKNYGNLPLVQCYAGQLNQVFMNIINNAIDSLEIYNNQRSLAEMQNHPSQIIIHTKLTNNNQVEIRIIDNGLGITDNIKSKLFDPFFTTKPIGKGTGLGLSISYEIIVNKHSGILKCESEIGKGTEFLIQIPLHQ
ncbi:HAMP domain-containing protein [Anabaena sp. UHCC 0253]|uniref:sensor histidine kinase n=1 Tax=Anabaena sp. UHCC 0253 TaxID=2590019 RepID=UPI0014474670|nr:ATP-binding protein [Anabaena sp. UHCC 0253]MTJ52160.1 HAMP domain-containing protein [Anabaena sp. UHCC 0253]